MALLLHNVLLWTPFPAEEASTENLTKVRKVILTQILLRDDQTWILELWPIQEQPMVLFMQVCILWELQAPRAALISTELAVSWAAVIVEIIIHDSPLWASGRGSKSVCILTFELYSHGFSALARELNCLGGGLYYTHTFQLYLHEVLALALELDW